MTAAVSGVLLWDPWNDGLEPVSSTEGKGISRTLACF